MTLRKKEDQAVLDTLEIVASFDCPFCGKHASVAEGAEGSASFHAMPPCPVFESCDPFEYLKAVHGRALN